MMTSAEQWLPCPGWEGIYEVSDAGNVRRVSQGRGTKGTAPMKPRLHTTGYPIVNLWRVNRQKSQRVHRLVATAFLGAPDVDQQVNHKNGIKTDNRLANLEWVTRSENMLHSTRTLGNRPGKSEWTPERRAAMGAKVSGERAPNAILSTWQVRIIRRLARRLKQREVAVIFGVSRSHISNIQAGRLRRAG